MKQVKQPGYALLFVLLVGSALALYCLALFRSSFYARSIPAWQTRMVHYEYQTRGLLEYGITFCIANQDKIFGDSANSEREIILSAPQWPPSGDRAFSGILTIHPTKNQCAVQAQLRSGQTIVCSASCCLIPEYNEKATTLRITQWSCSGTS